MKKLLLGGLLSTGLLLIGCGGGTTTSSSDALGAVQTLLTDAPAEYEGVYVTIDSIRAHQAESCEIVVDDNGTETEVCDENGTWYTLAEPKKTINLLTLQNGVTEDLGTVHIPVGKYTMIEMNIGETEDNGTNGLGYTHPYANYVLLKDVSVHELTTPSNTLKLNHNFTLDSDGTYTILIDFDANKSVNEAGNSGQWVMKPVVHASELVETIIPEETNTTEESNSTEENNITEA